MLKDITNLLYYVTDVETSAAFYEKIGFSIDEREDNHVRARLNDFHILLVQSDDGSREASSKVDISSNGNGICLYVEAEAIDEFYKELVNNELIPLSEPSDKPWGNREFTIKDPDGYKTVFWQHA